jgi:hypothetical protein
VPGDVYGLLGADGAVIGVPYFGDGSDGDVVIAADTNLARDMYYNNLTINTGKVLTTKGWRIFVKGTLTLSGTGKIASSGSAGGSGASGGGAGPGAVYDVYNRKVGGTTSNIGALGGIGQVGAGGAGGGYTRDPATALYHNALGGAGGAGGAGQNGAAGAAGSLDTSGGTVPLLGIHTVAELAGLLNGGTIDAQNAVFTYQGGAGGGGGGGQTSGAKKGGGGGGGGGFVAVLASVVTGAGSIEAVGGAGANGDPAGNTGGGGGGGGGFVGLAYRTTSGTWTTSVAGGALGVKGGTGADGVVGPAGNLNTFVV